MGRAFFAQDTNPALLPPTLGVEAEEPLSRISHPPKDTVRAVQGGKVVNPTLTQQLALVVAPKSMCRRTRFNPRYAGFSPLRLTPGEL